MLHIKKIAIHMLSGVTEGTSNRTENRNRSRPWPLNDRGVGRFACDCDSLSDALLCHFICYREHISLAKCFNRRRVEWNYNNSSQTFQAVW